MPHAYATAVSIYMQRVIGKSPGAGAGQDLGSEGFVKLNDRKLSYGKPSQFRQFLDSGDGPNAH